MSRRKVERIAIQSEEQWHALRANDVTASVVAALFDCHPYESIMGLFAKKTGVQFPDEDSKAKRRGRLLEDAVAMAVRLEKPQWHIEKARVYLRDAKVRIGATPDYFFTDERKRSGVLQIKTLAPITFKKHWTPETPPFWVTLQALTEAMLANANYAVIAAMVIDPNCPLHLFEVPRHAKAERRIRDAVRKFWADIAAGKTPSIDYERDGRLIEVLYPREEPGKVIDLRTDNALPGLLDERAQLAERIEQSTKRKETIENEIRAKIADAEAALVNGWRITLKQQHRKEHMVRASTFRALRITKDQTKEDMAA